ncbi:putative P-loop containing nucleoside triphosphate hydrolase [Helianthus annuus]|nr:putative P-loop containing nucleoside triphosphate hydrolase [Helianthus annuus]KAJ0726175.1 putative P-loop containing nucleoside triphosphate hydrolase [Helianthus annuus]
MHIKEVCLEGFKSYATRTLVPRFDPFFNAIAGLHGSGKSNILDSICFVLGITNLQQVRASNLQEPLYKQGQVGITKATVSVVFDNSDRSRSPIGYEECSEITVTRQVYCGGVRGGGCGRSGDGRMWWWRRQDDVVVRILGLGN